MKTRSSKSQKIEIFPMVLVQKWPFLQLFFLGNIGQENDFYDILKRENAFLAYKNKKLKKSRNWHFPKGVNSWFWSTNGHFPNFFLGNIGKKNVFYNILDETTPFKAIKTKTLKSPKMDIFPKGLTHGFGPKMAILPKFFF